LFAPWLLAFGWEEQIQFFENGWHIYLSPLQADLALGNNM